MWKSKSFFPGDAGYYSPLIKDFLQNPNKLKSPPSIHELSVNELVKRRSQKSINRNLLTRVLRKQYANLPLSPALEKNLLALANADTFTVTTGHQLNIFSGPVFTWYKLLDAITWALHYEKESGLRVVPVFWMATEDHDIEEIQTIQIKGMDILWPSSEKGPVGLLSTEGLSSLIKQTIRPLVGDVPDLLTWEKWYTQSSNLTEATRGFWNEVLGKYGLVILDASDAELKNEAIPLFHQDLKDNQLHETLLKRTQELNENYDVQVNPRELQLFYLNNGYRERIIKEKEGFATADGIWHWNKLELWNHVENHPENFSPNVCLRPAYQELLLPNIAVVGGSGEISYWLQLTDMFQLLEIPFPKLHLRTSVILLTKEINAKFERLNYPWELWFNGKSEVLQKRLEDLNEEFSSLPQQQQVLFWRNDWNELLKNYDPTLLPTVEKNVKRIIRQLNLLSNKINRHKMNKLSKDESGIESLEKEIRPQGNPQERINNYLHFTSFPNPDLWMDFFKEKHQGLIITEVD